MSDTWEKQGHPRQRAKYVTIPPSTHQQHLCSPASPHSVVSIRLRGHAHPKSLPTSSLEHTVETRTPEVLAPSGSMPPCQICVASVILILPRWAKLLECLLLENGHSQGVWMVPGVQTGVFIHPHVMQDRSRGGEKRQVGWVVGELLVLWRCIVQFWGAWKLNVYA